MFFFHIPEKRAAPSTIQDSGKTTKTEILYPKYHIVWITYVCQQLFQSGQPVVASSSGQISRFSRHERHDGYGGHETNEEQDR